MRPVAQALFAYKAAQKGGLAIEAQAYVTLDWRITPAIVERFRVELPQDSREADVVKTKDWIRVQSGHYH